MKKAKCKITGRDVSQDIKVKGKFPNREKTLHTKTTSTEVCNLINEYEDKLGFLSSITKDELKHLIHFIIAYLKLVK